MATGTPGMAIWLGWRGNDPEPGRRAGGCWSACRWQAVESMLGCQLAEEFAGDRAEGFMIMLVEVPSQGVPEDPRIGRSGGQQCRCAGPGWETNHEP